MSIIYYTSAILNNSAILYKEAFPHLHNADGSNGKDQDRVVKLTNQRYFIQRVLNKETRFAKSPAYLYYCVGLLEEKQIHDATGMD